MANYISKRGANVAPSYATTDDLPASTEVGDLVFVGGQLGIAVSASGYQTCDRTDVSTIVADSEETVLLVKAQTDTSTNYYSFSDISTSNHTITNNTLSSYTGGVHAQGISPYRPPTDADRIPYSETVHGASGNFLNGTPANAATASYLSVANSTDFDFASGDFTVEAWVYIVTPIGGTDFETYLAIASKWNNTSNGKAWLLMLTKSGSGYTCTFYQSPNGSSASTIVSPVMSIGGWHHIAISRASGSAKLYIDGVGGSATSSAGIHAPNTATLVGAYHNSGVPHPSDMFNGYISDLRIVKSAVYTSNFTPATAPLTAIEYTKFLLNPSISVLDVSQKHVLDPSTAMPTASTTQQLFSKPTLSFDGVETGNVASQTGNNIIVPASADFTFGSGDFTTEAWIYLTNTSSLNRNIFAFSSTSFAFDIPLGLYVDQSDGKIKLFRGSISDSSVVRDIGPALSTGAWHHVALTKASGVTQVFLNGTRWYNSNSINVTYPILGLTIGSNLSNTKKWNGYIQDFRVTKGLARYTADFTAPISLLRG